MNHNELIQQKKVEFYSASVNAWYGSAIEYDRSILTLASAGIGLLVTLATTLGMTNGFVLSLYIAALFAFLCSVACVLLIFRRNKKHIEDVLNTDKQDIQDPFLAVLDKILPISFVLGVFFASLVGICTASHAMTLKQLEEKPDMTTEKKKEPSQSMHAFDSVHGIAKLRPVTESFHGAGKLQPQPPAATPSPAVGASGPVANTPAPTSGTKPTSP